jgi:tungstate transport system ATP-binding protein
VSENTYEVRDLRQDYVGRTVLSLPSLTVREGERLALVGPSGAGKSTLLRLLNFLEAPTRGRIQFRGREIPSGPALIELRRQVTTVFQRPVLLDADVVTNACYGLRLRGLRRDTQARALLERVGLGPLMHSPARRLSAGEMQRVALARALLVEPHVLLLDEPTANLDPYNVGLIEEIVREHCRQQGTTVILVTHNIFQAKRMAERTGLILAGQLIELETTQAFFEQPRDPRTAAFLRGEIVC